MARKPREQWTEAYRKRIEREERKAAAEGRAPDRQRARGKRKGEARERRQRERVRYEETFHGLTLAQGRKVREFWTESRDPELHPYKYSNLLDRDAAVADAIEQVGTFDDYVTQVTQIGYDWFVAYKKGWRAVKNKYEKEKSAGGYKTKGLGYIVQLMEEWGVPDISWTYYH